jgi:hypothetical protein
VVGGPFAIVPDDDLKCAADRLRPTLALYIGGMGARGVNFHHEVFARMGYEAEPPPSRTRTWRGTGRARSGRSRPGWWRTSP